MNQKLMQQKEELSKMIIMADKKAEELKEKEEEATCD